MSAFKLRYVLLLAFVATIVIGLKYEEELVAIYSKLQRRVRVDESYKRAAISAFEIHGIDVSHYQERINWAALQHPDKSKIIYFSFIRATAGLKKDLQFNRNWGAAGSHKFIKGAYHYYHSDKNSAMQATNFISAVTLKKGDLPPVLDIEELPKKQSMDNWRTGLKNYLRLLEQHYGVQPMIYSGDAFFNDYLATDPYFENYDRLWIANYNNVEAPYADWDFWQYTDALPVKGIEKPVDGNVFKGSRETFEALRLP